MKTILCKDLGGPAECDFPVSAETFEELGMKCQAHVKEQLGQGNAEHTAAVARMQEASPEEQQKMIASYHRAWEEAEQN